MEIKEILETIALPARSNKKGWKETAKLDAIVELLKKENSPYKLVYKSDNAYIFGQQDFVPGKTSLLISSHADIVKEIQKPYSEYLEDEQYFKGTYDNLGTNGAAVNAMLNYDLPKNTYFTFTSEEETGRCLGAGNSLSYIYSKTGKKPYVIALDVTDEGYENNRLFTIEGLHGINEGYRQAIANAIMETEGANQACEFVRLSKEDDNSFLPKSYQNKTLTVFDESVFYAKQNCNSFSMCLPGDGEMHGEDGFFVKGSVMKGYCASLVSLIYKLTKSHDKEIEDIKQIKDDCVIKAMQIPFHKFKRQATDYSSYWNGLPVSQYWGGSDDNYPGQMSLADFDDEFKSTGVDMLDPDSESYHFWLEQIEEQAYEMMEGYTPDDFDVFYDDLKAMFGLHEDDDNARDYFQICFNNYFEYVYGEEEEEDGEYDW